MKGQQLQKLKIIPLLMILVISLIGCGKIVKNTPPNSTENETELETETEIDTVSDTNLYLAYHFLDGQKKYGYIDRAGDFVIQPQYNYGSDFSEGFAIVNDENFYKVINQSGDVIFQNEGTIESFQNGMAVYIDQGTYKMGYIDTTGTVVIKPTFLMATPFQADGTAIVSKSTDVLTIIDKSGLAIAEIKFNSAYTGLYDIKDGYAIFISDGQDGSKLGVVSLEGELIIPPEYNGITNLGKGNFAVKDPTGEFYEVLDTPSAIFDQSGSKLTEYIYYDVKPYQGDYASASDAKETFFIGLDGMQVNELPKRNGIGTLTFIGDLIKADIDGELAYLSEDDTIIWQADLTYKLTDTITIKQNMERLHRTALVVYPSILGLDDEKVQADINANLESLFIDSRSAESLEGLSVDDQFDATISGDLLTIHKSGYDYPSGAAHGMPIREYYKVDIKTGKFYTLKDLFIKNSNYLGKLDLILVESIQKSYDSGNTMVFPESFKGLTEDANFIITNDALIIYFYPYDIAAYAAGFQEFSIPYANLMAIIDVDGALWNSFIH
jgi:hypothetical protein